MDLGSEGKGAIMPSQKRRRPGHQQALNDPSTVTTRTVESPTLRGDHTVFILGAGVDIGFGVPAMTTLLRQLAAFAKGDGLPVHQLLRKRLPNLRFTFDVYAGDQSNVMLRQLLSSDNDQLIGVLRTTAERLQGNVQAAAVAPLLAQLCTIGENNQLSGPTATALALFAGSNDDVSGGEAIIDPEKLSLTRTTMQALRQAFVLALDVGGYSDEEKMQVEFFIDATSNIEQLLSTHFTRYLLGELREQKKYLYIIWMLWAFLKFRSTKRPAGKPSIYDHFPMLAGKILTFNYTEFFQPRTMKDVYFFHGRLSEYLQLDTRTLVVDDPFLTRATTISVIVDLLEHLRIDLNHPEAVDVPSIVPPTAFKPVTSRQQLLTWATADRLIQEASTVVVVGYSFAMADEHFNDLLRHANEMLTVIVVNPDIDTASRQAARILGIDQSTLASETRNGIETRRSGRLICVKSYAEVVTEDFLAAIK